MLKISHVAYRRIAEAPPYSIIGHVPEERRSITDLVRRTDR